MKNFSTIRTHKKTPMEHKGFPDLLEIGEIRWESPSSGRTGRKIDIALRSEKLPGKILDRRKYNRWRYIFRDIEPEKISYLRRNEYGKDDNYKPYHRIPDAIDGRFHLLVLPTG